MTRLVRVEKSYNMTLIDSPGLNDPNPARSNKRIFMDLINTIRALLKSDEEGINTIVQCIMPDRSFRIRDTAIMTMVDVLLMLSIFNQNTSAQELKENHPKISIVFNHVSRFDQDGSNTIAN